MQNVEVSKTGCLVFKTQKFDDERGYFTEIFKQSLHDVQFKQDNLSFSNEGTVRGMHFQKKNPQGKFVRLISGMIVDVVIDLRHASPTFGEMETFQLIAQAQDDNALYIPPGFAHGFMAMSNSILLYKCTTEYDPQSDGGINPLDPHFDFPWKGEDNLLISNKDKALPNFVRFCEEFGGFLYTGGSAC